MPLSPGDRDRYRMSVIASCYSRGVGVADVVVLGADLRQELGVESLDFEDVVLDLQERGWVILGGGETIRLGLPGIVVLEEHLRRELLRVGVDGMKASGFSEQYELWLELEWQRYQVWRAIYDGGGARTGQVVPADTFMSALGRSDAELGRAFEMIEHRGLAELFCTPWVFRLTAAGRDEMTALLDEFKKHKLKSPKRASYLKFLLKKWRWEADATAPALEEVDGFRHSDDYLSVSTRAGSFTLTPRIATVIRLLHRAHRAGTPDVTFERIRAEPEFEAYERLRDIFKPRHLEAFDALIRSSGRGLYRLNM